MYVSWNIIRKTGGGKALIRDVNDSISLTPYLDFPDNLSNFI